MIGISDVDYMDYDVGYYTTDFQVHPADGAPALQLAGDPGPQHRRVA